MQLLQWSKRGVFIATLLFTIFFQSVPLAVISGSFLLLLIIQNRFGVYIPVGLSMAIVIFIAASLILGSYFEFYEHFPRFDDLLHAFYGAGFAIIGFIIIQYTAAYRGIEIDTLVICLFSFCFALTGGVLWEIYEFTIDNFFGTNMQRTHIGTGVSDTMHDLIIETIAALTVNLYIFLYLKNGTCSWVSHTMEEFVLTNLERHLRPGHPILKKVKGRMKSIRTTLKDDKS